MKFDEDKYKNDWKKKNMTQVKGMYKNDFVLEFKDACNVLKLTQSEVIRNAMIQTIEKAKETEN